IHCLPLPLSVPRHHPFSRAIFYTLVVTPISKISVWRRLPLIHDMVAAVDVKRFAGDEAGGVVREEGGGDAHVLDADEAARRRLRLRLVDQRLEFGKAPGGPRRERAGRE